jgi:hypothetical protein
LIEADLSALKVSEEKEALFEGVRVGQVTNDGFLSGNGYVILNLQAAGV